MKPRRRSASGLGLLVLAALVVVGCTPDDSARPEATVSSAATRIASGPVGETAPPTPSSTPRVPDGFPVEAPGAEHEGVGLVDGLPPGAIGPLVVYTHVQIAQPGQPRRLDVSVFDLGRGEPVSSFQLAAHRILSARLAGDRVLAEFGHAVWSFAIDGSDAFVLYEDPDRYVERVRASPDARLVALGEGQATPDAAVIIKELRTGDIVLEVPANDPRWGGEFVGHPGPNYWLDETTLQISGWTYGHSPGSSARLRLDGTVEAFPAGEPPPRPSEVSVEMHGSLWRSCGLGGYAGAVSLTVLDASGAALRTLDAGAPVLGRPEVSPDGDEVLYLHFLPSDQWLDRLNKVEAEGGCLSPEWDQEIVQMPFDWRVLSVASGDIRVSTREETHREWYGARAVTFVCEEEELTGSEYPGEVWATPSRGSAGIGPPWGYSDRDCGWEDDSIELRVGGVPIAHGEDFEVLGFIEVP